MPTGIDAIVERRIAEAQARGEFDHLPGRGRPLELDEDRLVPEEVRVAYRVLKNAGCVPPEVERLRAARRGPGMAGANRAGAGIVEDAGRADRAGRADKADGTDGTDGADGADGAEDGRDGRLAAARGARRLAALRLMMERRAGGPSPAMAEYRDRLIDRLAGGNES